MSGKKIIAFPWERAGEYFSIDSLVFGRGLLTGHWSRSTEDLNNDGVPEITTTRSRDAQGRITKVEIVDARDANQNKTIALTYDAQGRVVTYDFQEKARPHTTTYEYDAHDHLVKETAVTTDLDGVRHTFSASHAFDPHGAIASTVVATDTGKRREERHYTPWGALKSLTTFDDAGNVFLDDQTSFDGHHRPIKRQVREFLPDAASGKSRLTSDAVEETTYQGGTDKPARLHRLESREFENPPGVFTLLKAFEETTTFPPPAGGVQHFESRTFNPGTDGQPVETALRIEDTTFDAKGRPIGFKGTNTDHNTGESKAVQSVTTYRTITVTTTDLGADGTDEEESVVIADEAGHVVESRDGKPDFGPFTMRQQLTYDGHGELARRVTFENNSDKPSSVVSFS
jgi:YD repeat-containing protein